jgi:hypothetical protein
MKINHLKIDNSIERICTIHLRESSDEQGMIFIALQQILIFNVLNQK